MDPRPVTVEFRLGVERNPAVLKPRCTPMVVDRIDDVKETEEI